MFGKLKYLLIVFIFNFYQSYGTILISLGGDCTVAGVLRDFGLRHAAYPFDWMFSSFKGVYQAIEDDFQKFLSPETLKIADDRRVVIDSYGLAFVHDFPTIYHNAALTDSESHEWAEIRDDWRLFIPPIQEKYKRRIDRLRLALNSTDKVYLIRYPLNKNEAIQIRDLIKRLFPKLDFTVVAVDGNPHDAPHWQLENIRNFSVVYTSPDFWDKWHKIFWSLGINKNDIKYVVDNDFDNDICTCSKNIKVFNI